MKGIILAGGNGTRLHPITLATSKQLIHVYDKPMIYYPLSTLIRAGIEDILIITKSEHQKDFQKILQDGSQLGCSISYATQDEPRGLAEAFIIGKNFIGQDNVCLILGDNIFYGGGFTELIRSVRNPVGGVVFGCYVKEPSRYGVIEFDSNGKATSIVEKPSIPESNYAVSGIYFYNNSVVDFAQTIQPSGRGELEITDINKIYLEEGLLEVKIMNRETAWFDTGTFESLNEASNFVMSVFKRHNLSVGSIEAAAYQSQLINQHQLRLLAEPLLKSGYGQYLLSLI